jgi:YD repeat-containing protein
VWKEELMKISRSLVAIGIAIAVVFAFVPVLGQVSAASKKTVYVVKSIKEVEDGKTGTVKLTYNKDGLLTKCVESAEGVTVTYTYGKNGQLKSATEKSKHGTVKANYTWKSGKMVKKAGTRDGGDKFSNVIKYRGDKPISSDVTEQWIDDQTGKAMVDKATCKYTYKNGKIVKSTGRMGSVTTFKYDKKGNAIDIKLTMKNEKGETTE